MATIDGEIAGYYKESFPEHFVGLSDKDVLDFVREKDPNFKVNSQLFFDKNSQLGKDSDGGWAEQNPGKAALEVANAPFQWFNNKMGEAAQSVQKSYEKDVPPDIKLIIDNSNLGKIMSGSKALYDVAEAYKSKKDAEVVSAQTTEDERIKASENRQFVDFLQGMNPIPKNIGEAVVGGAQLGLTEGLAGLLPTKGAINPASVESGLGKLGKIIPGADAAFQEAKGQARAVSELALREKELGALSANKSEKLKHTEAIMQDLKLDNSKIPQLTPELLGREIRDSVAVENPKSNAAITRVPIDAEQNALRAEMAKVDVPTQGLNATLGELRGELGGLIRDSGATAFDKTIGPYQKLHDFINNLETDPSGYSEFSSEQTSVSADRVHADISTLGDMIREATDKKKQRALSMVKEALENTLSEALPNKLAKRLADNNSEYATWYNTYDNEHINAIRNVDPSQMVDPIFKTPEARRSYIAATSPAEWQLVRANKVMDAIGKLASTEAEGSGSVAKTWETIKAADASGFWEENITPKERALINGMVAEEGSLKILSKDISELNDIRNKQEDLGRRSNDPNLLVRKNDVTRNGILGFLDTINTPGKIAGSVLGANAMTLLSYTHPVFGTAVAGLAAMGLAPEMLGRLYLSSPEFRSKLMDVGVSVNHVEALRATAQLASFIDAKTREVQKYKEPGKEGSVQKMPSDLKKFEDLVSNNKQELPKLTPDKAHGFPESTGKKTAAEKQREDLGLLEIPLTIGRDGLIPPTAEEQAAQREKQDIPENP